jgi:CheY-like chemotaxis protein
VADDDADARKILERLLTSMGCAVVHAADGRAALEAARRARPHLVVLDGMMPIVHGFEVCRAIKGDPALRRTPVVLFSAVYRGIVGSDAMEAFGADHFIEKPFRLEDAKRVFSAALSGGAAPEDPRERARLESAAAEWKKGARALSEGRVTEAVALCRQAVAMDRFSAEGHYQLGLALRREGQLFEAAAELERAAELKPEAAGPHQMLAQTYEQLGFRKTACQSWARAIETSRDPERKKAMQARLVSLLSA